MNDLELQHASFRERMAQMVVRYEDEIAQLRAEATQRVAALERRVQELEDEKNTPSENATGDKD